MLSISVYDMEINRKIRSSFSVYLSKLGMSVCDSNLLVDFQYFGGTENVK